MSTQRVYGVCAFMTAGILAAALSAAEPEPEPKRPAAEMPRAVEAADLLRREPISLANWPVWRGRLLAWVGDRSDRTDAAFESARDFIKSQADPKGELPGALGNDAFAWYLLGNAYFAEIRHEKNTAASRAEQALRRSLKLDSHFARAHRNLALALLLQDPKSQEARRELQQALRLQPDLPVKYAEAQAAFHHKQFAQAEELFRQAMHEEPENVHAGHGVAAAVVSNQSRPGPRAPSVRALLDQFPDNGHLVCMHGLALAMDGEARAATREFDRARQLGTDPKQVLPADVVDAIEQHAAPKWWEVSAWILAGFALFYAAVMALMAFFGLILAGRTRGSRALQLLGGQGEELVTAGQVARTRHETGLAKWYALALFLGLILFYLAIPFLIVGLLAGTALLLYLIFMLRHIPVKLIVIVVVVGLGGAWAVFKSLFASTGRGSFGLSRKPEEFPRLHQALLEVAQRIDTDPVHELYLAPGSSISVHQEGKGPFGLFGVKQRVLTLGLSTMNFLTVPELKAILGHEYAHFSHRDTFYSRFIYQVNLSIQQALTGMGESGGKLNYVNPFYWFLVLYYKAYNLLAAGYSRSREFLADRMACCLYGSDTFASALIKVSTDGSLFEMTMYDNIASLLGEGKAFVNMYEAFRSFRDEQLSAQEREKLYQNLLEEKATLFALHPTFCERIEAVKDLPKAAQYDATPASSLFENVEEIEKELTEFLTGYIQTVQHLQSQAAD